MMQKLGPIFQLPLTAILELLDILEIKQIQSIKLLDKNQGVGQKQPPTKLQI